MQKIPLLIVALLVITAGAVFIYTQQNDEVLNDEAMVVPVPSDQEEPVDFTASFEIFTNGTKRIFTQTMYHKQSPDVYITAANPSTISVKKRGITWDDFFKTLPFSVTKDCLITGTNQTFCTTPTQQLQFYLNEIENPDALDLEINEGAFLRIEYR